MVALLGEGWSLDDVAVVHHLSPRDLAVLDGVVRRPTQLLVALHWTRDHALWWAESEGHDVHPEDLAAWGVSQGLADDLAAWNTAVARRVLESTGSEPRALADAGWGALDREGYELALRLQDELWDVEVRCSLGGSSDRPVRELHP